MSSDVPSVPVVFSTQTPYHLPSQKFMIPLSWRRYQLSQLVNKALTLEKPVPFDFLVRGEVLRASIAEWCNEKGIGTEETLEIEYIESLLPPQHIASFPDDAWVSAVSCQVPGFFVTGSYDSQIRIYDASQKLTHTISGHSGPITSIYTLPESSTAEVSDLSLGTTLIASSSHDGTARLTTVTFDSAVVATNGSNSALLQGVSHALASLHLHTAPLSSVHASTAGTQLLTASWDHLIGVWDTRIPDTDEVPLDAAQAGAEERERKRRKRGKAGEGESTDAVRRKAPLGVMKSHTDRVSRALFTPTGEGAAGTARVAYSCGLDSTVRAWDVEAGLCTSTVTASERPFLDIAVPLSSPYTVIAASTDRTITVYDFRSRTNTAGSVAVGQLTQHSTPSTLVASPTHAHRVASGGLDGVVRVWDLRSTRPSVTGDGADVAGNAPGNGQGFSVPAASFRVPPKEGRAGDVKVLALDWTKGMVAVGGEAGLDVWRVTE